MKPIRRTAVFAACAAAALGYGADPIHMDVRNTFQGFGADTSAITVTLENDGAATRGTLRVFGDGNDASYPVDLPSGGRQEILTLNGAFSYGLLRFVFEGDGHTVAQNVPSVVTGGNVGAVALVGDDFGGLSFIRPRVGQKFNAVNGEFSMRDAYVKPEEAPGRAVAYAPYAVVVLAPGAERMDDAAVRALKDFALGGGTLVVLGGESAPVLRDVRWSAVLPGTDWSARKIDSSPALATLGRAAIATPFTVQTPGRLSPGAISVKGTKGASTFDTEKGLGLGKVVVLGYSPLEHPFDYWPGRYALFARFARADATAMRTRQFVEFYRNQGLQGVQNYRYGSPDSNTGGYVQPSDPFSARLPSTATVFGILAGYFVLVVPVSFLVLRRLKKAEWAWATAPLLSVGFAGVLFSSAQALYQAKLSTASQGVVVLQEGQPNGMFFGTSQMYFPRGGVYDLKLRGVDSLTAVQSDGYYRARGLDGFDPVDVATEVTVPHLQVSNLAFRELSYAQRIENGDWFEIDPVDAAHTKVVNRSPYRFIGSIACGGLVSAPFELKAGESKVVEPRIGALPFDAKVSLPLTDARNYTHLDGRIALTGTVEGFRPGPQVGEAIAGQSGFAVIAFAKERTQ